MFKFKNKETPLPSTRLELLLDTIKYRFFEVILLSLYPTLMLIPSIIWLIFSSYLFLNVETHTVYEIIFINFINIIFLMIYGLGVGGAFYVNKKIAFQEGEDINKDFVIGIKKNAVMFLKIFFMIGLLYALLQVANFIVMNLEWSDIVKGVVQGVFYAFFIILLMPLFFVMTQTTIYQGGFFKLYSNGIRFTVGKFLTNLPMMIFILIPFFIFEFCPSIGGVAYFQYGALILQGAIYGGISFLSFTLYSNSIFDKTINKEYPELINRGLSKDESSN